MLHELARVPYGQLDTYGSLAAKVGRPRAARAVGTVMNRNPIPIVLPCHRIVGANGSLTGYAGGLHVKRALLELEGATLARLSRARVELAVAPELLGEHGGDGLAGVVADRRLLGARRDRAVLVQRLVGRGHES